jgi:hypothetical protein
MRDYYYYKQFFSVKEVKSLFENGYAVDGTNGGVVLGPSHEDGGIYMLKFIGYGYHLVGEMEGYEYFLNPAASAYFFSSFKHFNDYEKDKTEYFYEYPLPEHINIIDARLPANSIYKSKFLVFENRFEFGICNKFSTKNKLLEINSLNSSLHFEYDSNDFKLTKRMNIYLKKTGEKIWSIRYGTKNDDPSKFKSGSKIKE